jgi:hypothetical protein
MTKKKEIEKLYMRKIKRKKENRKKIGTWK